MTPREGAMTEGKTQEKKNAKFMWMIFVRHAKNEEFTPLTDVHGNATAYPCRADALPSFHHRQDYNGKSYARLQKIGPIL